MRNRNILPLLLTAFVVLALLAFGGTGVLGQLTQSTTADGTSSAAPVPPAPTAAAPGSGGAAAPPASVPDNPSGLREVRESALPAEARSTLGLIRAGGPFRYSQDNQAFGNFERILPRRDRGYYREYTVPTPGESDRGARRIVAGDGGEKYYTDDHYETFRFIVEGS
ncbi:ribonuclease T1 [Pseudarthrobacter sp. W1I19]|uniref:ribonuclease domain-containing protein n=1 Tax=Pseudarthrobacter sp. W1I19 TaxID=3042288 RepID=UPI002785F857|nr:ribonuclease domain-containing protein [Pseudarthrobacter sp. W1I19]MDQ0924858.1 ribonuclease T1 [Pseudarthrobacter sp. W1I19]